MINKPLLKSKMILKDITQPNIAKALGLKLTTVNFKFNGKIIFKPREIKIIKELLNLTPEEVTEIFLS